MASAPVMAITQSSILKAALHLQKRPSNRGFLTVINSFPPTPV